MPRCGVMLASVLMACGNGSHGGNDTQPLLLVDHAAWALVATAEQDPFATSRPRPTVHACESGAIFEPSLGVLEVELASCRERYASIHQPSLVGVHAGDSLQFTLSHLLLRPLTESVTEAYLGLTVDDSMVWQLTIQILAPANSYTLSVVMPKDVPAGSDVVLHLDNHGENSYTFSPFVIVPAASTSSQSVN